ncbi:MAG TPA: DMT family transporter [Clostridia bacterium]|nr:DMT family transporter [Clostridia bacterium]
MSKVKNKRVIIADLGLLLVAILWGGGFVAVKDAIVDIAPFYMIAMRFGISGLIISLLYYKRIKDTKLRDIRAGILVGLFLFLGFATQTFGALYTTAGKQAFLTGTNVVIVPFLTWILYKNKLDIYSAIASMLCLVGIGFLTLKGDSGMNLGDILTLACAIFFAAHITLLGYWAKQADLMALTVTQMLTTAFLALFCAILFETPPSQIPRETYGSMIYIIVLCTLLSFSIQTVAQKFTSANHASIILCLESVFGSIFAVIFHGDIFTPAMIIGCALILLGIITAETKLGFLAGIRILRKPLSN